MGNDFGNAVRVWILHDLGERSALKNASRINNDAAITQHSCLRDIMCHKNGCAGSSSQKLGDFVRQTHPGWLIKLRLSDRIGSRLIRDYR
jgi:hypothetical protein